MNRQAVIISEALFESLIQRAAHPCIEADPPEAEYPMQYVTLDGTTYATPLRGVA